jgi:hypothetical protein
MASFLAHRARTLLPLLAVAALALFGFTPAMTQASGVVTLAADQQLNIGDQLVASNGRTRLLMQSDGNLVLYRVDTGAALWHSGTFGKPATHALMQTDGNFVLYNGDRSVAYWHAGTFGHPGASLQLADSGNLAIRAQTGALLWQTNTAQNWPPIQPRR